MTLDEFLIFITDCINNNIEPVTGYNILVLGQIRKSIFFLKSEIKKQGRGFIKNRI